MKKPLLLLLAALSLALAGCASDDQDNTGNRGQPDLDNSSSQGRMATPNQPRLSQ